MTVYQRVSSDRAVWRQRYRGKGEDRLDVCRRGMADKLDKDKDHKEDSWTEDMKSTGVT